MDRVRREPRKEWIQEYGMWVNVRRTDGTIEEREFPAGVYIEIGDILEDGSVVIDLPYPDDFDDDAVALDLYDD